MIWITYASCFWAISAGCLSIAMRSSDLGAVIGLCVLALIFAICGLACFQAASLAPRKRA